MFADVAPDVIIRLFGLRSARAKREDPEDGTVTGGLRAPQSR
jgi:hypothetical protein